MTTKLEGVRALVVGPIRKNLFCGFPNRNVYILYFDKNQILFAKAKLLEHSLLFAIL